MQDTMAKLIEVIKKNAAEKKFAAEISQKYPNIQSYENEFTYRCMHPAPRVSTGYHNLDVLLNGGLATELYMLGAETSTGKSAFAMSIAQNIAESRSADVFYFSLEMGKYEHIARGISCISKEHQMCSAGKGEAIPFSAILYDTFDSSTNSFKHLPYSTYDRYAHEYFSRYRSLHIIESGIEGKTVDDIVRICNEWMDTHPQRRLVIFIDYMQIILPDANDRSQADRKTKTDIVVLKLKNLAMRGATVFALSSISRENYGSKITTASYKESGDVEYTAGILLGWNWSGVTDEARPQARDEEKETCKRQGYRNMSLDILKHRNGERDTSAKFIYYPAYSYFKEKESKDSETNLIIR